MWPVEFDVSNDGIDAKKLAAAFRISLARFSSAFSFFSRFSSADSSVVVPGRAPASIWSCRTHLRSVSVVPMPSFDATAFIADHSVSYSGRTSATMRTARLRSSSGYWEGRAMTRSSQMIESLPNPERFSEARAGAGRRP
ncbi:hypothetical protein GCM10009654_46300 [Streptomyces hebeiensis]|uniref:Uncharacterized protein n=1 Tax=Streptomyces hebeiensis TaxID=229486 RepID=A0ABP4FLW8_9ACTN